MNLKFSPSTEGGGGDTSPGTAEAEDDITERGTNTTTTSKRPSVLASMMDPLKRRHRDQKVVGLGGKNILDMLIFVDAMSYNIHFYMWFSYFFISCVINIIYTLQIINRRCTTIDESYTTRTIERYEEGNV